jgi:1-acyl-sn-glycerol-3-phosphate acyltransferase
MHGVLDAGDVLGIFPEGRITTDGEISEFKPGIDKVIARQPVPVVPVALCNLWGSLFSRRDPLHRRRPYKLWSVIELRIGKVIPPEEVTAERLQLEVQKLRGDDR